jgi:tRNA threonylcarbamoyladenosine biosynthesis protein TsaE
MTSHLINIADLAALQRLANILAEQLPNGTLVALNGTLGAGKTRLVQAVASVCGVEQAEVISPTFVLCREYVGRRTIFHADAYRLHDEDEFLQLGPEEWFQSPALTFLEWAEKVSACLPSDYIRLDLEVTGETSRVITITAVGNEYQTCVAQIVERFETSDQN